MADLLSRSVVLVTRPEPGLSTTMADIAKRGWTPLAAPVLQIIPQAPPALIDCEAIAITSAQALPFLMHQPRARMLVTVGEKTAERARQAGFSNIMTAGGTSESLRQICQENRICGAGLVLACGRGQDGNAYGTELALILQARWMEAYQVRRYASFNKIAYQALMAGKVDAVLFYSSETVAAFMALCPQEIMTELANCRAFCLSDAIVEHVRSFTYWKAVELLENLGEYRAVQKSKADNEA